MSRTYYRAQSSLSKLKTGKGTPEELIKEKSRWKRPQCEEKHVNQHLVLALSTNRLLEFQLFSNRSRPKFHIIGSLLLDIELISNMELI